MPKLKHKFVCEWKSKYPIDYDNVYYCNIEKARKGDKKAIKELMRWFNPGGPIKTPTPMNLSKAKKKVLKKFIKNLKRYQGQNGEKLLRQDFRNRAPVYSMFFCHILHKKPILNKYTFIAYKKLKYETLNSEERWDILDEYEKWFRKETSRLKVTDRDLDQALYVWSRYLFKT